MRWRYVSLSFCCLIVSCRSSLTSHSVRVQLLESSCFLKLTFPSDAAITLEKAVIIETSTAHYLSELLQTSHDVPGIPPRFDPLLLRVEVADSIWVSTTATVTATVRLLYHTTSKKAATPLELASVLSQAVADADEKLPPFSFSASSAPVLVFSVNQGDDASIVIDDSKGSNYSSKEIGLIVVTVFLSVVLLIVSSVLLYITGGWTVCKAKLTDCLFEEVEEDEDDHYPIQQQPTFPIQHSEDADDAEDEESNITSLPPTSASGILGVSRNKNQPPPPLQSPYSEAEESSAMYGDGMTPVSNPLGITSMRQLPSPRGGFTGMVMQRMARSATKRK